jgi:hypothetical protein
MAATSARVFERKRDLGFQPKHEDLKMMSKIPIVSATALLALATAYANADDKRTDDKQASATFKAMDANRDDRLTANEVSGDPTLAQNFTSLDHDGDGYLSKKEYAAAASKDHMMKDEKERRPY